MKAQRAEIERALDRPDAAIRCILLHGPDEAGSRALSDRLAKAMGPDAERIDLEGPTLARDPALLSDEAASTSLFGGARWIRVRASGDEVADAVEALLAAPQAGNPVVILADALKPSSRLLKLALASRAMPAFASYAPEARDAGALVSALAQPLGLRVRSEVARRLFDATGGDRAILAQELEKLACFLDASESAPRDLDAGALDAVGAGEGEVSAAATIDAALLGQVQAAVTELRVLADAGEDGVALVRATLRRLLQLAALRSEADRSSISAAMAGHGKSLFWKDKPVIEAELGRWSSADLTRLIERVTAAQSKLLESSGAGAVLASQDLLAIARSAARTR